MVVVGRPERKVSRESEVIDAVGMGGKSLDQGAVLRIPDLDRLVVRGRVHLPGSTPSHASNGALVARKNRVNTLRHHVPHAHRRVL